MSSVHVIDLDLQTRSVSASLKNIVALKHSYLIALCAKDDLPVTEPLRAEDLVHRALAEGVLLEHGVLEHMAHPVLVRDGQRGEPETRSINKYSVYIQCMPMLFGPKCFVD